jgi:hypothetical protein
LGGGILSVGEGVGGMLGASRVRGGVFLAFPAEAMAPPTPEASGPATPPSAASRAGGSLDASARSFSPVERRTKDLATYETRQYGDDEDDDYDDDDDDDDEDDDEDDDDDDDVEDDDDTMMAPYCRAQAGLI